MKKVVLLLFITILVGVGCKNTTVQSNSGVEITQVTEAGKTENNITDKSERVLTTFANGANFSQDTSFLRPSEFSISGTDADYGRLTLLLFNNKPIFRIIENTIFSDCPKTSCEDVNELVLVSPEKYFSSILQSLEKEGIKVEDKKVGNLFGKMFVNKQNQATAIVLSEEANYTIIDEREIGNGDSLFNDFIASFQFNGELGNDRGFDGP